MLLLFFCMKWCCCRAVCVFVLQNRFHCKWKSSWVVWFSYQLLIISSWEFYEMTVVVTMTPQVISYLFALLSSCMRNERYSTRWLNGSSETGKPEYIFNRRDRRDEILKHTKPNPVSAHLQRRERERESFNACDTGWSQHIGRRDLMELFISYCAS